MKRTKHVLAFEQLEAEMEVLSKEQKQFFSGGYSSSGEITDSLSNFFGKPVTSSVDAYGNWMISIGGSSPIPLTFGLSEVTVTATGGVTSSSGQSFASFQQFFSSSNSNFDYNSFMTSNGYGSSGYGSNGYYGSSGYGSNGYYGSSGYDGSNGYYGSSGYGSNGASIGAFVNSGQAGYSFLDIAGFMNSALGTAASHADVAATAAKLENSLRFTNTARVFAVFDIGSNVMEIFNDKATADQKLEDGGQTVLGIALIFAGPVTVLVGGTLLVGWELYEYNRDN